MIIDELNKKIADIESLANDKTSTIESKVSDLTDGLLMVADAVDIIPEMVDEKITAITKEFSTIKDSVSKVKAQKGDNGRDGIDGLDGLNGTDGKDGSPDKPKDIADKLNTLDKVLDWKVLKDFDSLVNQNDLKSAIQTIENQTRFLIQSNASKTNGSNTSTTINGLAGSVNLLEGAGIDITTVGQDITIAAIGANVPSDNQLAVRMATTVALPGAPVYANGIAGVGATLTRGTNGALASIDGVTPMVGDYILVKNQAAKLQNGVYEVTNLGSASVKYVLTRVTEADTTIELDDLVVTAALGTTNKGIPYGQQTNNPVIGTSNIVFTATGIYVRQQTSGTQVAGQVPVWSGTALTLTKGDPLFTRNATTKYTEVARNYDAIVSDLQFIGIGSNDLTINSITVQRPYTFTIDSQNNYAGLYFQGAGLNDASVDYAAYAGQRPMYFTFGIEAANDESSTGNGGFTGTPINGEIFNDGLGNSFKFISYDIGTDTIYAYSVVGNVVGTYTGNDSSATVTLINTFTAGTNEVGAWGDSVGNDGVWSIQPTVAYTIGVGADSLDVTFPGGGHTVSDFWSTYFVQGAVLMNLLSPSGPFTTGETITQASNPGASAVIGFDNGGNIALINIVGQLNLGASSGLITGSTSGQTATLNTISSYSDTFTWTDGTTTENQVVITTSSQTLDSGNIDIQFASNASHVVGDQWQLTFPTVTITTGYETNQVQFPNVPFPLEASAMVATDGLDKMAVGVLDFSPFGQASLTAGILALYDDGSQSTFTTQKGFANLNLFDSTTNKSMNVNYSGDEFSVGGNNGSGSYGLSIDGNSFRYNTNGTNFTLPTSVGGIGYVVTDVNGDGILTLEPAAGGTIPGNIYEVVLSDGAGGAITTGNFQYNTATLVPTILSNEGIYYNPSNRFAFLGDNNTANNGNYVRVADTTNEIVINTNPAGILSLGNYGGGATRISINSATDVIDNYTQNGWNIRDFSGNDIMRVNMPAKQIQIGDPGNQSTGFWSNFDVTNVIYNVGVVGGGKNFLYINGSNGVMKFGDPDTIFTGTSTIIDTASGDIFNIASRDYIVMDTLSNRLIESNLTAKDIIIGDVSNVANNVKQTIINSGINAQYFVSGFNFGQGIFADFANKLFVLGDKQGFVGNGNKVTVDDGNQLVTLGGGTNGTSILINDATQKITFTSTTGDYRTVGLPKYADDTAAGVAGLTTDDEYQTDGTGAAPLNVTGIRMIKQ